MPKRGRSKNPAEGRMQVEDVVAKKGVGQFGDEGRVHHQLAPKFWTKSRGRITGQDRQLKRVLRLVLSRPPSSAKPLAYEKDIPHRGHTKRDQTEIDLHLAAHANLCRALRNSKSFGLSVTPRDLNRLPLPKDVTKMVPITLNVATQASKVLDLLCGFRKRRNSRRYVRKLRPNRRPRLRQALPISPRYKCPLCSGRKIPKTGPSQSHPKQR